MFVKEEIPRRDHGWWGDIAGAEVTGKNRRGRLFDQISWGRIWQAGSKNRKNQSATPERWKENHRGPSKEDGLSNSNQGEKEKEVGDIPKKG